MAETVLITGASRGIGAAAARRFAAAGYRVAINYHRSRERAEALCEALNMQYPGCAILAAGDVSDSVQVAEMVRMVENAFGRIDVLICNAGIAQQSLLTDVTDQQWRSLFATNVDGVFHACRAVLPGMIHHKYGRIITVSSMWGITGGSCEVAYSATKAAIIGMTRALAKEVGPSGITVNCVAPGVIDTEMNGNLDAETLLALAEETPVERIGRAEDVAEAMLYLAAPGAGFVTGQVLQVDGGMVIG